MNENEVALFALKELYPEYFREGLDLQEWARENILLKDGDNYALFEYMSDDTVAGHYFFTEATKEQSFGLAQKFIMMLFTFHPNVKTIVGKTPKEHKAALHLTRKLGFTHLYDTEENESVFVLNREKEEG